ncbi:Endoribonuclease l-psp family protein [Fusarium keratoplasticum]|nr:Endoribonuclease l-psp family protein [Fusarium keratoplasticum]
MASKLSEYGFEFHNWAGGQEGADMFGLSHAVIVPKDVRRVILSGQVGIKDDGTVPTDLGEEIREAFEHVLLSLKAAGLGDDAFEHVYSVQTYEVSKYGKGIAQVLVPIAREYFKNTKPAWTGVEVSALFLPSLHLEIRVEAYLPN